MLVTKCWKVLKRCAFIVRVVPSHLSWTHLKACCTQEKKKSLSIFLFLLLLLAVQLCVPMPVPVPSFSLCVPFAPFWGNIFFFWASELNQCRSEALFWVCVKFDIDQKKINVLTYQNCSTEKQVLIVKHYCWSVKYLCF